MFHAARWKAYLRNLQSTEQDKGDTGDQINIYQIFHSQMIWFVRDDANGYGKAAEEHIKRCDEMLEDCNKMVDALQDKLDKTPKPSELLGW